MKKIEDPKISLAISIIIPIIGLAVQWGVLTTKINQNTIQAKNNDDKLKAYIEKADIEAKKLDIQLTEIKVTLAEIQKDIEFIKTK